MECAADGPTVQAPWFLSVSSAAVKEPSGRVFPSSCLCGSPAKSLPCQCFIEAELNLNLLMTISHKYAHKKQAQLLYVLRYES
jgi:hypothetical protein